MSLTKEQIKALLALPQEKSRGRKPKNYIDTNIREIITWFKIGHKMVDEESGELSKCENPNCTDHRDSHMVVRISDHNMCRRCFLDGWLADSSGQ